MFLAGAIAAPLSAMAATPVSVTVGTAATNIGGCYPLGCNQTGSDVGESWIYQQVYASSAFSEPLTIDQIAFFVSSGSAAPLSGTYDITFSTTSAAVGSDYPIAPLSNTSTFYDGTLSAQAGSTYTITGSTPYVYYPSSGNLVIQITVDNQAAVDSDDATNFFEVDAGESVSSRAYYYDGADYTLYSDYQDTGTPLVTQFNGLAVPEASAWMLMTIGLGLAGAGLRARKRNARIAPINFC
jgi:hypothetical protein